MMSKTQAYNICKHIKEIMEDRHGSDSSYAEALGIVIDREEQPDEWMYLGFNGFGEERWAHYVPTGCHQVVDVTYDYCPGCGKRMLWRSR